MNEDQDLLRLSLQELAGGDRGVRSLSVLVSRHVLRLFPLPIMMLAVDFVDEDFEQDISMYADVLNACFAYKELLDNNDTATYQNLVDSLASARSFFRSRGNKLSKSKKLADRLLSVFFESLAILSGKATDAAAVPDSAEDINKLIECAIRCLAPVSLPNVDLHPYMESIYKPIRYDLEILRAAGSNGLDYSPLWLELDSYVEEMKSRFWGFIERQRDYPSPVVRGLVDNIAKIFARLHTGSGRNLSRKTSASDIFQPEKPSMVDSLNRESLAVALAKNLAHEKNRDSRTIGLLGDWGSGKTTFANMLKSKLVTRESIQPFIFGEFNAWSYEHTDNIQAGIAQELIKALTSSPDFSKQPVTLEKGESVEGAVIPPTGRWSSIKSFLCAAGRILFHDWSIVIGLVKKIPQMLQNLVRVISEAIVDFFKIAIDYLINIKILLFIVYLLFFSIPWTYSFLRDVLGFSVEQPFSHLIKNLWVGCFLALGICNVLATKGSLLKGWVNFRASNFVGWLKKMPIWSGLTLGWAFERLKLTISFSMRAHPFQLIKIMFLMLLAMAPWLAGLFKDEKEAKLVWAIVFGVFWLREVGKIVMNPLAKELMTYLRLPSYAKHLGEIPVMRENIRLLCKLRLREKNEKTPRLLFIVDDLDRCSHESIVKVLESIRLVLELENVVVIIAIDQHIALAALSNHFKEFSPHHKLKNSHAIAREYLSKVINLPVVLTEPSHVDVKNYMDNIWSDLPDISESEEINQVTGGVVGVDDVNLGSDNYEQQPDFKEAEIGSNNPQSKLNPIETLSREKRDSFIRWVKYFKLTNPRQLKRLNNSYDLMRSYFDTLDQETVSFSLPDEKSLNVYPMLLTLILMEYLNSLEDLGVRLKLWKRFFSTASDQVVFNNPNITQVDPGIFDKPPIDAAFIGSYRQLLQLKDYKDLEDKVKAFVLPAMV